jgi:hypothetical protein
VGSTDSCSATTNLCVPTIKEEWCRIVQSICAHTACVQATAINIVTDADDRVNVFGGSAEYDMQVIEEYLRGQGKAGGLST